MAAARKWIPRVLAKAPCSFPIRGIHAGLGEFRSKGVEYADLYVGFHGSFDPADAEASWLWQQPKHYPGNARLKSKALKLGGLLCNEDEGESGLSTNAYIGFSLGFSALLLREVMDGPLFDRLGGTAPMGVVSGFDSGDLLRLGCLSSSGLQITAGKMI